MAKKNNNDTVATIAVMEDGKGNRFVSGVPDFSLMAKATMFPSGQNATMSGAGVTPLTQPNPTEIARNRVWANWGINDNYPNIVEAAIAEVPTVAQAIMLNVMSLLGDSLVYCPDAERNLPQSDRKPYSLEVVDSYLFANNYERNLLSIAFQFFTFAQYMPIYTLDMAGYTIVRDEIKPLAHLRKTLENKYTYRSEYLAYSKRFGFLGGPREEDLKFVPLMDDEDPTFFQRLKGFRFARHIYLPLCSFFYYPIAPWAGLFKENGWIDIARTVPVIISALQNNQMAKGKLIKISNEYFRIRYSNANDFTKDWDTMNWTEKKAIIDTTISEIERKLTSPDARGRNIAYVFEQDDARPEIELGHIKIEDLGSNFKNDDWLPDISEANNQIVQGLGANASIYGLQPQGGKMGAGSGSDKMQGRNIQISTNTSIQALLLDHYNYISKFNKWGVTFYFRDMPLTTKDKSEGGFIAKSE